MCHGKHNAMQCPDKDVTWCSLCLRRGHTIDRCRGAPPATEVNRVAPPTRHRPLHPNTDAPPRAPAYNQHTHQSRSKPQPNIHPERAVFIAQAKADEKERELKTLYACTNTTEEWPLPVIHVFFAPPRNSKHKLHTSQPSNKSELKQSAIMNAGSSLSLISEKFYKVLFTAACARATFKHRKVRLPHAGSGNLKILGATKIEFIRGQSYSNTSASTQMLWHFLVIPNLATDFILGWDFMKHTASISDAGKLSIYFPRADSTCQCRVTSGRQRPSKTTLLLMENASVPAHTAVLVDVRHPTNDAFAHSNRTGVVVGRSSDFIAASLFVPQARCSIKDRQTKLLLANTSNTTLNLSAERHM